MKDETALQQGDQEMVRQDSKLHNTDDNNISPHGDLSGSGSGPTGNRRVSGQPSFAQATHEESTSLFNKILNNELNSNRKDPQWALLPGDTGRTELPVSGSGSHGVLQYPSRTTFGNSLSPQQLELDGSPIIRPVSESLSFTRRPLPASVNREDERRGSHSLDSPPKDNEEAVKSSQRLNDGPSQSVKDSSPYKELENDINLFHQDHSEREVLPFSVSHSRDWREPKSIPQFSCIDSQADTGSRQGLSLDNGPASDSEIAPRSGGTYCKTSHNFRFALDWLEIRTDFVESPLRSIHPGTQGQIGPYKYDSRDYGTRFFENYADFYLNGRSFASVMWGSRIGDPGQCVFKIENYILYEDNVYGVVSDFMASLNLTYTNVVRLDVAIDGLDLGWLIRGIASGAYVRKGQSTGTIREDLQGYSVGRRSYKYIRYYNKTKQMVRRPKKYIADMHSQCGLDVDMQGNPRDVFRLEFEFHWSYLSRQDFDLEDFFTDGGHTMCALIRRASKNYFDFVESGRKNKSQSPHVWGVDDFLPIDGASLVALKAETVDHTYTTKISLRRLVWMGVQDSWSTSVALLAIKELISCVPDLHPWLLDHLSKWHKDLSKECFLREIEPNFTLFSDIEKIDLNDLVFEI